MAALAWRLVVTRLEEGARLLDLVLEASENVAGAEGGTMLWLFHNAVHQQAMVFAGGKSFMSAEGGTKANLAVQKF